MAVYFDTLKGVEAYCYTMTKHTPRDRVWQAALERRDTSHYFLVDDILADVEDVSEKTVRDVLNTMEEMGLLSGRGGLGPNSKTYEHPHDPGECEWCGAPFPEAGRIDVTEHDADGLEMQSHSICSACVSDKY